MASNFTTTGGATSAPTPMTDGDITPPPASTAFTPAAPLKDAGVEFDSDLATDEAPEASGEKVPPVQALRDGAQKLTSQAGEKARGLAEQGKNKAGGALDHLAQMLTDAATQVDDKVGAQYGHYARTAADTVSGYAEQVRNKDVDALLDDARELVRKSPAIAIGTAAAVGFVLARLVSVGVENRDTDA